MERNVFDNQNEPYSLEAEQAVLGCLLINPDCLLNVVEELKSDRVSSKKMASFKTVLEFTFILVGTEALICLILFILHRSDAKLWFDIVLVLGTLYCIFFEVITAVLN